MTYEELAQYFKVLAGRNRLEIIDVLSCGELCACDLLAHFDFSQPTLSHHMKMLVESGIVSTYKTGNRRMYHIESTVLKQVQSSLNLLNTSNERCICKDIKMGEC
ncbi:ArsR/SmtB family transcription factor [Staphylococcus massiliensis]|uniref:Arsenical resistance operon repressor n=1 Tax=Staphylococcus massiliensis S46 TaxID=1229783 RepID=K9B6L7_9STAP|nr:metalloregulator ArsR/SmtB family transcription factor [Staphylococcus massiliensis]EKU50452.1 arsenical resistance operon repressor [Staphylococcus massiliensis S46]